MIVEHRVLKAKTMDGSDLEFEVNWSNHKKIKDCQIVRIRQSDKEFEVKRDELVSMLMMIGREQDIKKLLPIKVNRIRKLERLLTFEWVASRDYKRGERITVKAPWIDTAPETEEVFAGNVPGKKSILIGRK